MNLSELKQELFKDPRFQKSYFRHDLAYDTSRMLIEARVQKGMTQAELAARIGSTQSSVARVENGKHLISLDLLQKIAKAYETDLTPPKFAFMDKLTALESRKTIILEAFTTISPISANASTDFLLEGTRADSESNKVLTRYSPRFESAIQPVTTRLHAMA